MGFSHKVPFYEDKTTFVKKPFLASGRTYNVGDEFPWKERGVPAHKAHALYRQNFLYHDDTKAAEKGIGDGLDLLNLEELHNVVNEINETVKSNTSTQTEYTKKKVKTSKIRNRQIDLIRQWRTVYGHLEIKH